MPEFLLLLPHLPCCPGRVTEPPLTETGPMRLASTSSDAPSAHAAIPPLPISVCDLSAESDKTLPRFRPCRWDSNRRRPQFPPFHPRQYLLPQGKHYPVSC